MKKPKEMENIPCSRIRRTNIGKMSILPKQSTHSMQSLSKNMSFLHRARTNNPKMCKDAEKIPKAKVMLKKKTKVET